ncbi:ABC transporter substrate-binding protein [Aquitalea magnusonii]|nr:ABC transporter substrate-binding protein [Aquitalea magnusonii]
MKQHTLMMTAILAAGSFALPAMAESTLRYGIEAQYPPFEYKSASGELQGLDVELGKAVCAEAHLKCSWVENAFDGLIPALQGKKFDAINSAMNATEQRRKSIAFTSIIYRVPSMVIARKGSGITTAADKLQGKSMGVLQGSIQETYARSHWESAGVRVVSYQDQNQVYADMATGRLDATLVMAPAGQKGFLTRPDGKDFQFVGAVHDDKILGSGIAFGLRKDDVELRKKLDAAIARLQASGKVKVLAARYLGEGIDVSVK